MPARFWRDPLWRRWLAACVAGEVLGIGVGAAAAGLAIAAVGEPASAAERWGVFALLVGAGAIEGIALGGLQWRVVRGPFPGLRARGWVGATVAVAVAGWALGMLPSTIAAPMPVGSAPPFDPGLGLTALVAVLGGAAAGALFGAAQWWVFRRHVSGAGRWVGANALGWALALAWIYVAAALPPEGTPMAAVAGLGIVAGLLSGLSVGAVTGVALVRLVAEARTG